MLRGAALVAISVLTLAAAAAAQEAPLPEGVAARVGDEQITKRSVRHWAQMDATRREAMVFLLQSAWIRQEATRLGIAVSPRRVRRALAREKRRTFDSEREYRRFLRRSGMREADVRFRLRHQLLTVGVTKRVSSRIEPVTRQDVSRNYARYRERYRGVSRRQARSTIRIRIRAKRQQVAIERFVRDFESRYRGMTVCAEDYAVAGCGSTVAEAGSEPAGDPSLGGAKQQ